jgi:hypothetical protein
MTNAWRPFPFPPGGPFTFENVKEILHRPRDHPNYVLTTQRPPSRQDIERLAFSLNDISGAFRFSRKFAGAGAEAERVSSAIETLTLFFGERRRACSESRYPPAVVESERALCDCFWDFVNVMANHTFELDMDAVLMMPEHRDWHSIAEVVAASFKLAMVPNNPDDEFGRSNNGPVPRFVAAVVPMITGEDPRLGAVAQHLKRKARA